MFTAPSGKEFKVHKYSLKFVDKELEAAYLKKLSDKYYNILMITWKVCIVFCGVVPILWKIIGLFDDAPFSYLVR